MSIECKIKRRGIQNAVTIAGIVELQYRRYDSVSAARRAAPAETGISSERHSASTAGIGIGRRLAPPNRRRGRKSGKGRAERASCVLQSSI